MTQWQTVQLKGQQQVMPRVCPNCLAPSTHSLRYGYKGWKGWLTRTTYYQTFYYCEPCCDQADSALGLSTWGFWMGFLGVIGGFVGLAVFADAFRDPVTHRVPEDKMVLAMALAVAASALLFGGVYALVRTLKRRRFPPREGQILWGPAAYYTGGGFMDLTGKYAVYRVARSEWARELVRDNPEQVDDATYQALVGAARPSAPAVEERPFG